MTNREQNLDDLHKLRSLVASRAKLTWGFGVACGYLSIVAILIAWMVGWEEWAGPLAAAVLAIVGRASVWWSESYRNDAEWTIRTIELNRGVGYEVDLAKLADLRSKYFRTLQKHDDCASDDNSAGDDDYFEASGSPSYDLLIKMERESAWWTEQLAKKASKVVFVGVWIVAGLAMLVILLWGLEGEAEKAATIASEVFRRAYGLAICAIVLLDTINLGLRYRRLSVAAKASGDRLTTLLDRVDDMSVPRLMTTVSDYQSARKEGPLIPDRFKRYNEKALQRVWNDTLSMKESRDT